MTFITVASQRDNLGDSLLRRPLVHAAQGEAPCHVYVGSRAEQWTNLGLRGSDKSYSSRRRWYFALLRSALVQRTSLVLNAGELLPDRRFTVSRALMLPAILLVKLRGGAVIHAGFGLRDPHSRVPWAARVTTRLSDIVSWRDEASRLAFANGTVAPDWAFAEGASTETMLARHHAVRGERVLAVSLRGDRPMPTADWVERVKHVAAFELGARVVVVCQVRRDAERAEWLASELGAELVAWPEEIDHSAQEARVRSVYSGATWIASNRLHSVIMAVTEGAVPLELAPNQTGKVLRALAVADLALVPTEGAALRISADQARLRASLDCARNRLRDLSAVVGRALTGDKPKRVRVLHTTAAPGQTTRYSRHMAATEDFDVRPVFLGWHRALFGRFDVLHVHWPEHFVPNGSQLRDRVARLLARLTIRRLRRRRTPVIRTLHNVTPHRVSADARGERLRRSLDALTRAEVHLVPGDEAVSRGAVYLIPHGSYREPYADVQVLPSVPGRVLHFGRLEQYKGVPELLVAMKESKVGQLRIVGSPADSLVAEEVESAAAADARISFTFGFVPDEALAREISEASLCVFPYRELHSSGAVLVALSLNRRVLVPRTVTTEALQQEVGDDWVRIYDAFDSLELDSALAWAEQQKAEVLRPDLSDRSWQLVRSRHRNVVRAVVSAGERVGGGGNRMREQRLIYLDTRELEARKRQLESGDSRSIEELAQLTAEASVLMHLPVMSVMDKTGVAASGDRHDFYAIGGYSWPNDSSSDGLPYQYRDSETNPEALESGEFDKGSYEEMTRRVAVLALAYFYTDESEYAVHAASLLRAWFIDPVTRMNPNFRYAAARPGVWDGHFSGAIEGVFLIEMLDFVSLLQGSAAWTAADDAALRSWFRDLSDWLAHSRFGRREMFSTNNHGSYLLAQVLAFASFGGHEERARAVVRLARSQLRRQIKRDGSLPLEIDRADGWFYSVYGLRAFAVLARLSERYGVDLWHAHDERVAQACVSLAPYLEGTEDWPFSRGHKPWVHDAVQLYHMASRAYGSASLRSTALCVARMNPAEYPHAMLLGLEDSLSLGGRDDLPAPRHWSASLVSQRRSSSAREILLFRTLGVLATRGLWWGRRLP